MYYFRGITWSYDIEIEIVWGGLNNLCYTMDVMKTSPPYAQVAAMTSIKTNTIETPIKLPFSTLETLLKLTLNTPETYLKHT